MISPCHLVIDLYECPAFRLKDEASIRTYIDIIVAECGLTARGAPLIDKFPGEDSGITAAQVLSESLLSLHSYPAEGVIYIDIFSCSNFNHLKAICTSRKFFTARRTKWQLVDRSPHHNLGIDMERP
jgi:S-adenosylmethionine/arginine decarboxylase-like enzyme